jgi:hypothetical protein
MVEAVAALGLIGIAVTILIGAAFAARPAQSAPDPPVLDAAQSAVADARAAFAYDPAAAAAFGASRVLEYAVPDDAPPGMPRVLVDCSAAWNGAQLSVDCWRAAAPQRKAHLDAPIGVQAPAPGSTVTPGA